MMTYRYDPEENMIHLQASGTLVRDDPISYFRDVANDTAIKSDAIERVYFQNLDDIAFTYSDILQISAAFDKYQHASRLSYSVFVTDSDFTYGMARMIISIFGYLDHDFRIERVA